MYDETVSVLTSALRREQLPVGEWRQHEGKPSAEVNALPFYRFVPKDPIDQLRWRLHVRKQTAVDLDFREAIRYACQKDILFALNTIYWIFEPRPVGRKLPFNTWADQDDYICWIWRWFGKRDIGCEKCRGIGWSYLCCAIFHYDWTFTPLSMLGMMSRKEDAVDDSENPDSLFYKLDFMQANMPDWLRMADAETPVINRAKCRFVNRVNGSTIFGYESTGNVMTGGRKRAVLEDEAAKFPMASAQEAANSVQHVTNCRVKVSTYYRGTATVFYNTMRREESTMLKIRAHWHQNPERSKGLYTFEKGKLVLLDKEFDWGKEFPDGYKYIDAENDPEAKGQKVRSPWYDFECSRPGTTKAGIAEELDIDPKTASTKLIDMEVIDKVEETARAPLHRGRIDYVDPGEPLNSLKDFDPIWVRREADGEVKIWRPLTVDGHIVGGPYKLGVDLGSGRGGSHTSNSSLEVLDENTGEHVLEFYSNKLEPGVFAQYVVAIMLWLSDDHGQGWCHLTFENNGGPGEDFADEIERLGWSNVEWTERRTKGKESIKKMGWRNTFGPMQILLSLGRAILRGQTIVHSKMVAAELDQYELIEGKCVHSGSFFDPDGNTKGLFHGDTAVAYALAWRLMREKVQETTKQKEREIPYGSLAHRMIEAHRNAMGDADDWWVTDYDETKAADRNNPLLNLIQGGRSKDRYESTEPYS